ncbi:hypothetical protein F4819DRAFT_505112 [Hypoxylon fuscum]|nr:hypothetical protein F4819DRAFT_505112 [Hypoxylon fuscum]
MPRLESKRDPRGTRFRAISRAFTKLLAALRRRQRRNRRIGEGHIQELRHQEARHALLLEDGEQLRSRILRAHEAKRKVPKGDIYRLAAIESVLINTNDTSAQSRLATGLLARLGETKVHSVYYFLSYTGYFYKSAHPLGNADDLSFIIELYVPVDVRMLAYPYRQLCRTRA